MAVRPSVIVAGAALVAIVIAACAEGAADDLPFGTEAADSGPEASGSKLPPKGGDDDDDDVTGDDDDDDGGTTPKPDAGTDAGGTPGGLSAACTAALAAATWDFESGDQGWSHKASDGTNQGSWPFDPWSRGPAVTIPCPAGSCWAGERNQNYAQCSRGELLSPTIDLSACASATVTLTFSHAYAFWTDSVGSQTWFDGGIVEISGNGGTSWTVPSATFPGTLKILKGQSGANCVSNAWHTDGKKGFTGTQAAAADFSIVVPSALVTTKTRLRFSTAAGASTPDVDHHRENTEAGWRIDNVRFTAVP